MRLSSYVTIGATFISAAALCMVAAGFAVTLIEENSRSGVKTALEDSGLGWADADANGLQLFLIGTAPSEALRFKAITTAGSIVDAARVIDQMEVADREAFAPPRFSIEILRNDRGVSVIGLAPDTEASAQMLAEIADIVGPENVSDLLETARYPAPEGWAPAMEMGMDALALLPRSKISIDAGNVAVIASAESPAQQMRYKQQLRSSRPSGVELSVEISAPRPVISPFTLRFIVDETGARFDACSVDNENDRETILETARTAGLTGWADCTIGLGAPSRQWVRAATLSIEKLAAVGGGSVTISDTDISLIALEGTDQALFDRVVGEFETALPDVFALHSALPVAQVEGQGPPEFVGTLSPEGQVQLRGRVSNELARETADSYAKARFGSAQVYTAARLDETLPRSWSVRVLAGIEALSMLNNGAVTVTPDRLRVFGETGQPDASAKIAQLLAEKLGEGQEFAIEVTYQEKLDPVASLPTPEECELQLAETQTGRKIGFEPGSDTLDAAGKGILDDIAEILLVCGDDIRMEISGHTDSQGREVMNEQLSQSRAQAVLNALRERRVMTSGFIAKGYGEANPIADNSTEEGREANRRIEFKWIRPEPATPEETSALDALSEDAQAQTTAEEQADEQN
jgi:OOP family OmpA-OmpF porin